MMTTEFNFGKLIKVHRLFGDTYLAEFEHCIAIVKVNANGEIIRVTRFGSR